MLLLLILINILFLFSVRCHSRPRIRPTVIIVFLRLHFLYPLVLRRQHIILCPLMLRQILPLFSHQLRQLFKSEPRIRKLQLLPGMLDINQVRMQILPGLLRHNSTRIRVINQANLTIAAQSIERRQPILKILLLLLITLIAAILTIPSATGLTLRPTLRLVLLLLLHDPLAPLLRNNTSQLLLIMTQVRPLLNQLGVPLLAELGVGVERLRVVRNQAQGAASRAASLPAAAATTLPIVLLLVQHLRGCLEVMRLVLHSSFLLIWI